jgi:SAM-dependent methyltransferase
MSSLSVSGPAPVVASSAETRPCAGCQTELPKSLRKRCTGCRQVIYCGLECQKKDWAQHRLICTKLPGRAAQSAEAVVAASAPILNPRAAVSASDTQPSKRLQVCLKLAKSEWDKHAAYRERLRTRIYPISMATYFHDRFLDNCLEKGWLTLKPGDVCLDLGAAKGFDSLLMLNRGAHVTAIDSFTGFADMSLAFIGVDPQFGKNRADGKQTSMGVVDTSVGEDMSGPQTHDFSHMEVGSKLLDRFKPIEKEICPKDKAQFPRDQTLQLVVCKGVAEYMDPTLMPALFEAVYDSLKPEGYFIFSFNITGGLTKKEKETFCRGACWGIDEESDMNRVLGEKFKLHRNISYANTRLHILQKGWEDYSTTLD